MQSAPIRAVGEFFLIFWAFFPTAASLAAQTPDHMGQVTPPCPLGELIRQSDPIVVLEVDHIDRENRLVGFQSVKALPVPPHPGITPPHPSARHLATLHPA